MENSATPKNQETAHPHYAQENGNAIKINGERLVNNMEELGQIGITSDGGVTRLALSGTHMRARYWFKAKIKESGLEFKKDGAGNHSALLKSRNPNAKTLLMGSHLDTVNNAGRFDGALGVMGGFEVLCTLKEKGIDLPFNVEVVDFTDEEGSILSFLGSFALTGKLDANTLTNPRGGRQALIDGMNRSGLTERGILSAKRDLSTILAYLELHVEQGRVLEDEKINIGVVTNIPGVYFYNITFLGRADHAASPMQDRLDASQGSSAFTLSARECTLAHFPGCVTNVGAVRYEPGLFNVVPEKAVVSLEFRAPDCPTIERLEEALLINAHRAANRFGLALTTEQLPGKHQPAPMSATLQNLITESAHSMGLKHRAMPSWPVHDAQSFAAICPTGMIFVPSVGGISHSPKEFTHPKDCINGANVLLNTILRIADLGGNLDITP